MAFSIRCIRCFALPFIPGIRSSSAACIFYGGSLLSILLAFLCDWLIVRFLIPPEGIPLGSVLLTLTPLLLIFSVGSYVSDSFMETVR